MSERDLVLLMHTKGVMTTKELQKHFKDFLRTDSEKAAFIEIVKRVAEKGTENGKMIFKLKQSVANEYGLA